MPSKKIELQKAVSRPKSIQAKLSQLSWEIGLESFFMNKVPFDYSNGLVFADRLTQIIDALIKDSQKNIVTIAFLGAGLAYLPKHILDLIFKKYSQLKNKVRFIISDFDPNYANQLHQSNHLRPYKHMIQIESFNILKGSFSRFEKVDGVILTYLFGSLPTRHLRYQNKKFYEYKIESYITSKDWCLHLQDGKPKILKEKQLKSTILGLPKSKQYQYLAKVHSLIKEKWVRVPLKNISQKEKNELKHYIKSRGINTSLTFNYSKEIIKIISQLKTHLPAESLILVYDVSDAQSSHKQLNKSYLYTKFGACLCVSTHFDYLNFLCTKNNWKTMQTTFPFQESQCWISYNMKNEIHIKTAFENQFKVQGVLNSHDAIQKINAIKKKDPKLKEKIENIIQKLNKYEQESYELNIAAAQQLKKSAYYKEAIWYLLKNINRYRNMALSSHQLMSEIYYIQDPLIAEKYLSFYINKFFYHSGLKYLYCISIGNTKENKKLSQAIKDYIFVCDSFIPWRFILVLALQSTTKNERNEYLRWLLTLDKEKLIKLEKKIINDANKYLNL